MIDIFNHGGGKKLEDWINGLNMGAKGIVKTEFRPDLTPAELVSHCQNDVRAHWELAEFFRTTYENIGAAFNATTSSTALDLFKRRFFKGNWFRKTDQFNDIERLAYYGGRTECFSRGQHNIKSYDINSAYVSVMASEQYPNPTKARHHIGDKHFKKFYRDPENLMIVHCTVFAPKSRVMVLPHRIEDNSKLLFPWGKFTGSWCSPELHAAEKYGYKILKVHDYIRYGDKEPYFAEYANYTWEQRHLAAEAGDEGMKTVWKLFGNGLYGKLAQRNPVGGQLTLSMPDNIPEGVRFMRYITPSGDVYYSVPSGEKVESINSFPCISAFITCYTRLKLLEYLKRHEKDVVYCDTDSIKIPMSSHGETSSNALGGVKLECSDNPEKNQCGEYIFLKPKLYGRVPESFSVLPPDYDFNSPISGLKRLEIDVEKNKWKIKGVGRYDLGFFDLENMIFHAEYKKPNRFKESIMRSLKINEWCNREKDLVLVDDKRVWFHKDSEPLHIIDCETI